MPSLAGPLRRIDRRWWLVALVLVLVGGVALAFTSSGTVTRVAVKAGDRVTRGALLATQRVTLGAGGAGGFGGPTSLSGGN